MAPCLEVSGEPFPRHVFNNTPWVSFLQHKTEMGVFSC